MSKQIIYVDLDGILTDFAKLYKELFQRDAYKDDPFTVNQFCLQVPHFFRILPMNPDGLDLFYTLKDKYKIIFLTTPMQGMKECRGDKIEWVRQNLGEFDVFFSNNKAEYVLDSESILIDDMEYNLKPWRDAGGTGIKYPQRKEKILQIIENTLNPIEEIKTIKEALKNIEVEAQPTEAQKESGNYKKGAVNFKGIKIKIENVPGSFRFGFDETGKKWISRMKNYYGYIIGTDGNDNECIDCFIGPNVSKSIVFVINQGKNGLFDEVKIMLGFETKEDAQAAYLSNYQKGWKGLMSIKQTNTKKFRDWLKNGNKTEPF